MPTVTGPRSSRSRGNPRWAAMAEQFDPELEIRRHLSMAAPLAWTEAGREWKTAEDVREWKEAVGKAPWLLEAAGRVAARIERQKEGTMETEAALIKKRSRTRKGSAAKPEPELALKDDDAGAAAIAANKEEAAKSKLEAAAKPKANGSKKSAGKPSWKTLPNSELQAHLLAHTTLSDGTWREIREARGLPLDRNAKESRSDFIERVLSGE